MQAKNIDEFVRENAPCYIYQKKIIDKSCQKLQEKFKNVEFYIQSRQILLCQL